MVTLNLSLTVPDLPDSGIWFANAQAWKNYFRNVTAEGEVAAAITDVYAPVLYNNALAPVQLNYAGNNYVFPSIAMFESLLAKIEAMETCLQNTRSQLKDAGYITEAQ
jgi:hypothetical protein